MLLAESQKRRKIFLELGDKVLELKMEGEKSMICPMFRKCNSFDKKNRDEDIPLERTSAYINMICREYPSLCEYSGVKKKNEIDSLPVSVLDDIGDEEYDLRADEDWESYIDAEEVHTRLR
jgi:hypothetical protein